MKNNTFTLLTVVIQPKQLICIQESDGKLYIYLGKRKWAVTKSSKKTGTNFIAHRTIPNEDVEEVKEMFDKSDNEYYVTKF